MKHLGQLCLVATLIFTLTFSAYAGEIECPGIPVAQPQAAGEIECGLTDVLLIMLALI
jgi:hypothetical protein